MNKLNVIVIALFCGVLCVSAQEADNQTTEKTQQFRGIVRFKPASAIVSVAFLQAIEIPVTISNVCTSQNCYSY
jgi:hypothetical protein